MARSELDTQFTLPRAHYLEHLDMVTWLRHFQVLRDLLSGRGGDVLEIGTGDGIVRRCAEPFVGSFKVLDINPNLDAEFVGDIRDSHADLAGRFDTVIATEVMEHLPFDDMPTCLANLSTWLRPGGRALVSLPHRKSSVALLTPKQRFVTLRFPNGVFPSEFYNRFVRGRIWTDPNHFWEIGDGRVRRRDVERRFAQAGFVQQERRELPYSDYWVLTRPSADVAS
jgi:SAM-dependent methyltransferase